MKQGKKGDTGQKAVFRLRTNRIGSLLGIDFKKVKVHKAIWFEDKEVRPSIQLAHMYSDKVTNKITGRSIFDTASVERYIPPTDFVDQLAQRCEIVWDYKFSCLNGIVNNPIISTAPLIVNMGLCGIQPTVTCTGKDITVNRIPIPGCDTYCTMYYPHPLMNTYRASITGGTLIVEGVGKLTDKELNEICWSLGIPYGRTMMNHVKNTVQKNGKIFQINNHTREKAIVDMTVNHNLYSLGRFATWRPKGYAG